MNDPILLKSDGKYNNWGEREPLVSSDNEKINCHHSASSRKDLSVVEKSFISTNILTGCEGLEFVVFSNAVYDKPLVFSNDIVLYPCFLPKSEIKDDPISRATSGMYQLNRYIYDGWLPIKSTKEDVIRNKIRELRETLSAFSFAVSCRLDWFPKYFSKNIENISIHLKTSDIDTINGIAQANASLTLEDRIALFRSIGWISQSYLSNDDKSKFLFCVLAIESLANYIESECDEKSAFIKARTDKLPKKERKELREEEIKRILNQHQENLTHAVSEAYFDQVVSIKRKIKDHLVSVMGENNEGVKLFFGDTENKEDHPLYDLRHRIAHGMADNLSEADIIQIRAKMRQIEKFANEYLWKLLNRLNIWNESSSSHIAYSMNFNDGIMSRREMYRGPTKMALFYL